MIRPARQEPIRIGAPSAPASRTAREAAAGMAGPALRAVLRGDDEGARAEVAKYDDETIDALTVAADRLAVVCREIRGGQS
jgi:hypothetical protein